MRGLTGFAVLLALLGPLACHAAGGPAGDSAGGSGEDPSPTASGASGPQSGSGDATGSGPGGETGDPASGGDGDAGGDGESGGAPSTSGSGSSGGGDTGGTESCGLDLATQFERADFELQIQAQQDQTVPVVVAPDPRGGLWLAWTDSPWSEGKLSAHVRHLDASLVMGPLELDIPDSVVLGMVGHGDGTVTLARAARTGPEPGQDWAGSPSAPSPNTLYLTKFDGNDRIFDTKLRGGEGYTSVPESTWLLSDHTGASVSVSRAADRYGLLYVIGRHFDTGEVHQADEYLAVGLDGEVLERHRTTWINSHSFWPSSLARADSIHTLTIADPFPVWGLRLGTYDRDGNGIHATVWPSPDLIDRVEPAGPVGRPGALFEIGDRLATVLRTWVHPDNPNDNSSHRAALLSFRPDGTDVAIAYLASGPAHTENDMVAGGARFGTDILTLVGVGANASVFGHAPIVAQILTRDGTPVGTQETLDARLSWSSDPVTLSDGSVAWAAVKDNVSTTLQVALVRCN